MALPQQKNLSLYRGDDYELLFRLKDDNGVYLDLTGFTPKAQIRATTDDTGVMAEFDADLTDQVTLPGGVSLVLTHTQSGALVGNGVWDFQVTTPDDKVYTYLYGTVTLLGDVTRP